MKKKWSVIAILVGAAALALTALAFSRAAKEKEDTFYLGGIQVSEPDYKAWTGALDAVGMNTVPVTVYAKQGDWDSDDLWFEPEEPYVIQEIRAARSAGLKVVLILRVALDHAYPRNRFLWHGMIMPKYDLDIDTWFERYTAFVVKWARIAEEEGIDVLGIGSEMNALSDTNRRDPSELQKEINDLRHWHTHYKGRVLEFGEAIEQRHLWTRGTKGATTLEDYLTDREAAQIAWLDQVYMVGQEGQEEAIAARQARLDRAWRQTIAAAREVYDGKLTYASNFDSYHVVSFWSELDTMGVNAYFKLRAEYDQPLTDDEMGATFTTQWDTIFKEMEAFRVERGVSHLPLIFTELGYTFRKNSTFEPWSYTRFSIIEWDKGGTTDLERHLVVWGDQPVDYRERRVAIDALYAATRAEERRYFRGLLYWKFSTNPDHAEIEPFVMHVGPKSTDPLQSALLKFARER